MKQKHFSTIIDLGIFLGFILFVCLIILISGALADSDDQCDYMAPPAFEWEGELNPDDFDKWNLLSVQPNLGQGGFWIFIGNPDPISPIRIVVMEVSCDGTLLEYRYFKEGQPYEYVLDLLEEKYKEYHFTPEERKGCMKCHQDKFVIQGDDA